MSRLLNSFQVVNASYIFHSVAWLERNRFKRKCNITIESTLSQVEGVAQVTPLEWTTFSQFELFATAAQSFTYSPEPWQQTRPLARRSHATARTLGQLLPVKVAIFSTWVKVTTEKVKIEVGILSYGSVDVDIYNVNRYSWLPTGSGIFIYFLKWYRFKLYVICICFRYVNWKTFFEAPQGWMLLSLI